MNFEVERAETVSVIGPDELLSCDLMSPYVWKERGDARLNMLVRGVVPDGAGADTGKIWYGRSGSGGLVFSVEPRPVIVPDVSGPDAGGCEDPTVVTTRDGYIVLYIGVDRDGTGHLLHATGATIDGLVKCGIALANSKSQENTKEATIERVDGTWRLLYKYARDGHSLIGLAEADKIKGPWRHHADPFGPSEQGWDRFHLSTGPLWTGDPRAPVMFYNGADASARWGVGWVAFTPSLDRVIARSEKPIAGPPGDVDGPRDMNFAASIVDLEGCLWLYYSRNDRELKRAVVRRTV